MEIHTFWKGEVLNSKWMPIWETPHLIYFLIYLSTFLLRHALVHFLQSSFLHDELLITSDLKTSNAITGFNKRLAET